MNTTIKISFTKITFFDPIEQVANSINVQGKFTVKESKELIPTDTKFIMKEFDTDTFEVPTDQLLSLRIDEK